MMTAKNKLITDENSILPVSGISLSVGDAGIRYKDRDDLLLIEINSKANSAAVFTQNAFSAAPVQIAKAHLKQTQPRYLIVNSGNANAGTGKQGTKDALDICQFVAKAMKVDVEQVLPFSTGVIGERLNPEQFYQTLPSLTSNLSETSWSLAACAIMTTDTKPKVVSLELQLDDEKICITGIAKGAGMICPDMATMLSYVATDAKVSQAVLQECLNEVANKSFNRVTVDGDTSTNDACVLIASNRVTHSEIASIEHPHYKIFKQAVMDVCVYLAQAIIRDGEGATKFVSVNVSGGKSAEECLQVAYTVAHSPLVKTALFASDPNWGRILAAVGRSKLVDFDIAKVSIALDEVDIISMGEPAVNYTEALGSEVMQKSEFNINIHLQRGDYAETIWTTDLSQEYVVINAEYRT